MKRRRKDEVNEVLAAVKCLVTTVLSPEFDEMEDGPRTIEYKDGITRECLRLKIKVPEIVGAFYEALIEITGAPSLSKSVKATLRQRLMGAGKVIPFPIGEEGRGGSSSYESGTTTHIGRAPETRCLRVKSASHAIGGRASSKRHNNLAIRRAKKLAGNG